MLNAFLPFFPMPLSIQLLHVEMNLLFWGFLKITHRTHWNLTQSQFTKVLRSYTYFYPETFLLKIWKIRVSKIERLRAPGWLSWLKQPTLAQVMNWSWQVRAHALQLGAALTVQVAWSLLHSVSPSLTALLCLHSLSLSKNQALKKEVDLRNWYFHLYVYPYLYLLPTYIRSMWGKDHWRRTMHN